MDTLGAFEDVVLYCAFVPALNSCYVGSDALVDIVLFIVPLPLVCVSSQLSTTGETLTNIQIASLKLSRSRRIAIMLVFSAGAL